MKKTQKKDAVRNIRKRIASFLSICLVIMLGLGGFFVVRYLVAGINAKATEYYADHKFKDYELISSLGITDDDLSQIKEADGITDAEGVIRADGSLRMGELNRNVEVISMTERISVPEVLEGKAPAAKDECMLGEDFAEKNGLKTGDRISLTLSGLTSMTETSSEDVSFGTDGEEDEEDAPADKENRSVLFCREFTVTGLMRHPDYFRRNAVNTVVLPMEAYDREALDGYYTHAFVKSEEPEGEDIFSDGFFEKTAGTKKTLEELTVTLAEDSAKRARNKAYARIDGEWQKALAQLEEGQNEIDDNEEALNDELADARKKLEDAQKELDSKISQTNETLKASEKKIRDGEKTIRNGEKKIRDSKNKLKAADRKLASAKKYLKLVKDEEGGDLDQLLRELTGARKILDKLDKLEPGSEEYDKQAKKLARHILDNEESLHIIQDFARSDEAIDYAKELKKQTGVDCTENIKNIRKLDIDGLCILAQDVSDGNGDTAEFIEKADDCIKEIEGVLDAIGKVEQFIKQYEKERKTLYRKLADKEKELARGKKELAAAKEKLAEAKRQFAAEKSKYQAKIRNGWSLYYSQKADYESRLEEAKELLAENREKAEEKLAEARAEVEKIECKWLVFDRRANAGYVDVKSALASLNSAGTVFGLLFLLISSLVCFSTLVIIIEEQKKMVGTVKAFGFHKNEVLGKYLVFGTAAAVTGCIAGILAALGLSEIVLKIYNDARMYQFDGVRSVITPGITVIACVCMIIVCTLATIIACTDVLKSPASVLMKGGSIKTGSARKKSSSKKGGSLYSKLILRNMLDDKARVLISIAIIAFSTLIVGAGISTKMAFDGLAAKQLSDVHRYDVRVDLGSKVTDGERSGLTKILTDSGADFIAASYETHLFRWDDRLDALYILTGDPDELGNYFAIRDTETGGELPLPDDGVLVQKRLKESFGMVEGTEVPVMDSGLDMKTAVVKGDFQNYAGRIMVTSPAGYRSIFGEDPEYNCYYVRTNGADIRKLESDLLAVTGEVSFEEAGEFTAKFGAVSFLYNIVVYMTTGIAILMSFMILTNLANIFLNRKKTELTVMRINGFSIKQTKGYLARETVVTTVAGVALGVLAGAFLTPFVIMIQEPVDTQFVRTFHPAAWIAAAGLELLFSIIINSLVFRKVKDLNFRDVA